MKILLFEPLLWNDIVDYPDLGSAMLVSACKKHKIDVELIVTQRRIIEYMFCHCSEDIVNLFNLIDEDKKNNYKLISMHCANLKEYLLSLYEQYYSKSWEQYFNSHLTLEMKKIFLEIISLQDIEDDTVFALCPICKFFQNIITNCNADIIGFSMYEASKYNMRILGCCKLITNKTLILGGAFTGHLTKEDIYYIQQLKIVDYLILGQADLSLPELIVKIANKRDFLNTINNVIDFGISDYNLLTKSINKSPVNNLNKLDLPDFTLSSSSEYACPVLILPIQTARGCTWRKCTFCSHHNGYFGEYHCWGIKEIVNNINILIEKYSCTHFVLHDDDIPVKRLLLLAREIKRRNIIVKIFSYVRPTDGFLKANVFKELFDAGFVAFSWGVESGSQEMLDKINKGTKIAIIEKVLKSASINGASNICWIMINIPDETRKDFEKTTSFMNKLKNSVHLWMVSPFRMQYDSPMYKDCEHNYHIKKDPLEYSLKLSEDEVNNENLKTTEINLLYDQGFFKNLKFPFNIIPVESQRARIIPFIYTANKTFKLNNNVVIIKRYKEIFINNNVILKSIYNNGISITLNSKSYINLLEFIDHKTNINDEIIETISILRDKQLIILLNNE